MKEKLKRFAKRLERQREEKQTRRKKQKVHCPECDTTVWKDTLEEASRTAETHEDQQHDSESTVLVNGMRLPNFSEEEKERLQEFVEEASS